MLIQDIVRRVRDAAGDSGVLQFDNETVTDWINDAIRACVEENSLLQARASATTTVGQQDYTLPVDIFKIHSVFVNDRKVPILTLSEWEDQITTTTDRGTPSHSCVYAGFLSLYPIPNAAGTLTINYTKNPKTIIYIGNTEGDAWSPNSPDIPESFHTRLVTYCLAQVAFQDDDIAKYQALMGEFKTGVMDLKHLKDETENLYPYMHYVDSDGEV